MRIPQLVAVVSIVAVVAATGCVTSSHDAADTGSDGVPTALRDTGLYADWARREVAADVHGFAPAFPLFSDGAQKSRWIYLPPGTQIDASDLDEWTFPVGTKLWKEFRHNITAADGNVTPDQRIETRMLWKRAANGSADDWSMVTYVWSADQTEASLALETDPPPVPFPGTADYEVPVLRCHDCHDGRRDKVLGFDAPMLAAPEADQTGVTYASLVADGLIGPSMPPAEQMQFLGSGTAAERTAVGYLHTNCGVACHHASSGQEVPFFTRIEAGGSATMPASIAETQAFATAVNVASVFVPAADPSDDYRIRPTDVTRSTVVYRMSVRNGLTGGGEQMPPIATHEVDTAGVAAISTWVDSMRSAPYPAPGP
jgi:hypothetical protein